MKKSQNYEKVPNEEPEKEPTASSCSVKRVLLGFVVVVLFIGQVVFTSLYPTLKINKLEQKLNVANEETQKSLRHFTNERIGARINEIKQMNTKDNSELRQSFKDANDHLNVLIFTVGNLSAVVLRMKSSSDLKMSRLRWNLNATKDTLIRLQTELTQLNYSVHTDMVPFVVEAVNDLRQELKSMFHNDTLKQLRSQLNETRHGLQRSVGNQIARANKTWQKALKDSIGSLHSLVAKIDVKVNGIKQELLKSINNKQKEMKDDFSQMKAKFQEKDRKCDVAISGQESKIESMEKRIAKLENAADGLLKTDIQLIFLLVVTTAGLPYVLN